MAANTKAREPPGEGGRAPARSSGRDRGRRARAVMGPPPPRHKHKHKHAHARARTPRPRQGGVRRWPGLRGTSVQRGQRWAPGLGWAGLRGVAPPAQGAGRQMGTSACPGAARGREGTGYCQVWSLSNRCVLRWASLCPRCCSTRGYRELLSRVPGGATPCYRVESQDRPRDVESAAAICPLWPAGVGSRRLALRCSYSQK